MFLPTDLVVDVTVAAGAHAAHLVAGTSSTLLHGPVARLVATTAVGLQENPGDLPGGDTLQKLTNGIGGWALILSLVGLVVGAAAWALGSHSQNYQQSYVGRRTVLVSGLAALLIGAAPGVINFFFHSGQAVH